jgi:hypothetical protein
MLLAAAIDEATAIFDIRKLSQPLMHVWTVKINFLGFIKKRLSTNESQWSKETEISGLNAQLYYFKSAY